MAPFGLSRSGYLFRHLRPGDHIFSLLHKPSLSFRDNLLAFYSRRVKRLMPALWAVVVIGAILISLFNRAPGFSLQTGIASLLGISNLYLLNQATDYFAPATELNIFTHTWSPGVEEQFYPSGSEQPLPCPEAYDRAIEDLKKRLPPSKHISFSLVAIPISPPRIWRLCNQLGLMRGIAHL